MDIYCIKDHVVSNEKGKGLVGRIIGLNPYQNQIAFQETKTGRVYIRELADMAIGIGCIYGVCVQDMITTEGPLSDYGQVIGVNPHKKLVAYRVYNTDLVFTASLDKVTTDFSNKKYKEYARTMERFSVPNTSVHDFINLKLSFKRPVDK